MGHEDRVLQPKTRPVTARVENPDASTEGNAHKLLMEATHLQEQPLAPIPKPRVKRVFSFFDPEFIEQSLNELEYDQTEELRHLVSIVRDENAKGATRITAVEAIRKRAETAARLAGHLTDVTATATRNLDGSGQETVSFKVDRVVSGMTTSEQLLKGIGQSTQIQEIEYQKAIQEKAFAASEDGEDFNTVVRRLEDDKRESDTGVPEQSEHTDSPHEPAPSVVCDDRFCEGESEPDPGQPEVVPDAGGGPNAAGESGEDGHTLHPASRSDSGGSGDAGSRDTRPPTDSRSPEQGGNEPAPRELQPEADSEGSEAEGGSVRSNGSTGSIGKPRRKSQSELDKKYEDRFKADTSGGRIGLALGDKATGRPT